MAGGLRRHCRTKVVATRISDATQLSPGKLDTVMARALYERWLAKQEDMRFISYATAQSPVRQTSSKGIPLRGGL